jgi:protein-disulfide isomerase
VFALAVPGLSVVLYLAYASLFVLKTYCIFCLITYVAVAGIFLVSGAAADGSMTDLPRNARRDLKSLAGSPVGLLVTGLFVAGAVALVALFPRQVDATTAPAVAPAPLTSEQQTEFDRWYESLPRVPVAVPTDGAKVLIVKFNDYQCPPCRMTWEQYKPVIAKYQSMYPGKVKFVTKDFPLDPECNVNTPQGMHQSSCEAAAAVRMARAKGRAEAMEEWLFGNQPQLTPDLVKQAVRSVGGVTDFDTQYPKVLELVKSDIAMGAALQVHATPTFFINGVRIPIVKPEYFDQAIAYELKH